jgi:hypothetical protein
MITPPPGYQVMGGDGKEYGPVAADQIRKWILEQRLERKTPVRPPDAKDWVFLGSLPEFTNAFEPPPAPPKRNRRKWVAVLLLVLAAGLIMLAWKQFNPH